MNPERQTQELAKLDDNLGSDELEDGYYPYKLKVDKDYLNSRDAIVLVITKQRKLNQFFTLDFHKALLVILFGEQVLKQESEDVIYCGSAHLQNILEATPSQLAEALLRAAGKWEDDV